MAIDGVAPRAKMNQQRARRFRSAMDAEKEREKALKNGLELPQDPFDSNAITPGTEFMAKLSVHLKYFIHKKVSTDSSWQNIEIILSGHEVPGEGEHKIMHHIRVAKAQPGYHSNTRHCLYGLDADLIMLGLLSHDPHFAILREEVLFGPSQKMSKELTEQNFFLLHLSIVREYLEMEFDGIEEEMTFTYDFERILDDFILLNFFIGNDFLPELPSLLINDGALPFVIESYKNYLRSSKSYITKGGIIDFVALASWIEKLGEFEYRLFEKGAVDLEWINEDVSAVSITGKQKDAKNVVFKITEKQLQLIDDIQQFTLTANCTLKPDPEEDLPKYTFSQEESDELSEEDVEFLRGFCSKTYLRVVLEKTTLSLVLDIDGIPDNESERDRNARYLDVNKTIRIYLNAQVISSEEENAHKQEIYSAKFTEWKDDYYRQKFHFTLEKNKPEIQDICENYLEGLQWVLLYYMRGIASWGWYFRYHYAPKISDIHLGLGKKISFDLGHPFHPFEQLMAVLPERSKSLVPLALRPLMTEDTSPIKDFYPHTFELDQNGKKASWEAVVKIPFVDEKRLIEAVKSRESELTPAEKKRNGYGTDLDFVFNPQLDTVYPSSFPGFFADIAHDHTIEQVYVEPSLDGHEFVFGLCDGAKLGVDSLAGFPSLKTLSYTFSIEMGQVKVFERPARRESLILTINNSYSDSDINVICNRLLDISVYVGWPYLREAKVIGISDKNFYYEKINGRLNTTAHQVSDWGLQTSSINSNYQLSGVKVGEIDLLIHVVVLKGVKKTKSGAYVKDYETKENQLLKFPLQTVVENVQNEDPRFVEKPAVPVEEEFPVGSHVVSMLSISYGTPVTVVGHSNGTVDIEVRKLEEKGNLNFGRFIAEKDRSNLYYQPSFKIAKILHISTLFLSKITAKMVVLADNKKFDIGLNIRNEGKRLKVLGYSQRNLKGWNYSELAIKLIRQYLNSFPLLGKLMAYPGKEIPDMAKVLGVGPAEAVFKMEAMRTWLKENAAAKHGISFVSLETEGLSRTAVQVLERTVIERSSQSSQFNVLKLKHVPRQALFTPDSPGYTLSNQRFDVGDRVVSILDYGKVPLFTRGTVISIHSYASHVKLDILFDVELDSGNTLDARLSTPRGLTVESNSVLNLSNPQLAANLKENAKAKDKSKKKETSKREAPVRTENVWTTGAAPAKIPTKPVKKEKPTKPNAPKPSKDALNTFNEDMSKQLLSILHNKQDDDTSTKEKDPLGIDQSTAEKSKELSQNRLHNAVMGQFTGNLPPAPMGAQIPSGNMPPMFPPHPHGVPGANGMYMPSPPGGPFPPGPMFFPGPPPPPGTFPPTHPANMMMYPPHPPLPSGPQMMMQGNRNFNNGPRGGRQNRSYNSHGDLKDGPIPPQPRGGGQFRGRGGNRGGRNHRNNDHKKGSGKQGNKTNEGEPADKAKEPATS